VLAPDEKRVLPHLVRCIRDELRRIAAALGQPPR
jgi:hypothetical protein